MLACVLVVKEYVGMCPRGKGIWWHVSAWSTRTWPTLCPRGKGICWHVSAWSTTTLTQCPPHCQHNSADPQLLKCIQIDFAVTFCASFLFLNFFKTTLRVCLPCRWLRSFSGKYGAQVEFLREKGSKISWHCPSILVLYCCKNSAIVVACAQLCSLPYS